MCRVVSSGLKNSVNMPLRPQPLVSSQDHGQLQIGFDTGSGDIGRAGRESRARGYRQIDFSWNRTDLPLDRRRDVREAGEAGRSRVEVIIRQIDQNFQAGRHAQSPSRVAAVECPTAVKSGEVQTILVLETSPGDDDTGIGHVGPIGIDLVRRGRAAFGSSLRRGQNQHQNRRRQASRKPQDASERWNGSQHHDRMTGGVPWV